MVRLLLTAACFASIAAADTPLRLNTATPPFVPFDQTTPPGVYGHMMTAGRPAACVTQPVSVITPGNAEVTVYGLTQPAGLAVSAEEVFGVEVGKVYRLKIDGIDGLPGVAVYPTIELVDRLHPPVGQAAEFPVLIEITADEIDAALADRLVTKVIYVRPRNDTTLPPAGTVLPTTRLSDDENVVEQAMYRGRPIAVLRMGGRTPESPHDNDFFVGGTIEYPIGR